MDTFRALRDETSKPLFVMLRPRPGSFVYDTKDKRSMLEALASFQHAGADGFVAGGLTPESSVDTDLLRALAAALGDVPLTFHRAFDAIGDATNALELMISHNVQRVLTSGGASSAEEGIGTLKKYAAHARGRILILPGGGIRPSNIGQILHDVGSTEVHSSGRNEQGILDSDVVALLSAIAHTSSS